jgi:hypothetical protein
MMSIVSKGFGLNEKSREKTPFDVFSPNGKPVYANSDGVGTKTEFYERAYEWTGDASIVARGLQDSLAMKADDDGKIAATARVIHDNVETNLPITERERESFREEARAWNSRLGISYSLNFEDVSSRLHGWSDDGTKYFNISGSAVSTIDEEWLKNPPKSSVGEYLIAIAGLANSRSNGHTKRRGIMTEMLGKKWHLTPQGHEFLDFLTRPSTVLYPVFGALLEHGDATSFYHMSGGAYNGKLAQPLAEHGLYVAIKGIFPPDWREQKMAEFASMSNEAAYAQWPMGNDGVVTTKIPDAALNRITAMGLNCMVVGQLEQRSEKTGVTLVGIKGSDGEDVYFSGKN